MVLILVLILEGDFEINPSVVCKHLNICHINIRSLSRAKHLAIQTSLANVHDIITISEMNLHQGAGNDLFDLRGIMTFYGKIGVEMVEVFHTNLCITMKIPT